MAKQLNVSLNFTAETGQAKAAIQELQQSLSKIAYAGTGNIVGNSAQQIKEASEAAKQLQYHLNNAYNATTGNFDLSRLDRSLQSSKTNIADLSAKLLGAGSAGQQAFVQLAQSISMADQPMFRVNAKLTEMLTTLKNTARWQISSSILHGFMGTIQHAYGYAQDLNESLNNIRIVTGQNVDQMAKFAEQANKSAKALSTTTTEYTNASLIYYQQGLTDAEVKERTDVTVKMANAAGVSAQTVSDQMTAVWNNFDDGSKSLEYYADVMTALGAATASSTDEIAAGLEKFAAVSETVGLSYEYATAALATVTATTRQSADVVGNAFKTLFARIQGLNLGETLDDGTTLNKYSSALLKVGINIKDQNDQIKEMDTILNELGNKWKTIDKDQQIALAQTVAGVRQYTQLMALMDNWDYFGENLQVALGSEGELQKQADIYAESWEAASDRVSAAAESIYQNLLDDKFFISVNNGFANLLTGIGEFIKGIGGAKGVITAFGSIFLTNFAHKMPEAVQNLKYNIQVLTKGSTEAYTKMATDLKSVVSQHPESFQKQSSKWQVDSSADLITARTKLANISDTLTNKERQMAEMNLNLAATQAKEVEEIYRKNEALQKSIELQQSALASSGSAGDNVRSQMSKEEDYLAKSSFGAKRMVSEAINAGAPASEIAKLNAIAAEAASNLYEYRDAMDVAANTADAMGQKMLEAYSKMQQGSNFDLSLQDDFSIYVGQIDSISAAFEKTNSKKDNFNVALAEARKSVEQLANSIPEAVQEATGLDKIFEKFASSKFGGGAKAVSQELENIKNALKGANIEGADLEKVLTALYGKDFKKLVQDSNELKAGLDQASNSAQNFKGLLEQIQPKHIVTGLEAITAAAAGLGNFAMGLTSIKSAFQALSNPDLSGFEKFTTILTSISMTIPMGISLMKNLATVYSIMKRPIMEVIMAKELENAVSAQTLASITAETIAEAKSLVSKKLSTGATKEEAAAEAAKLLISRENVNSASAKIIADILVAAAEKGLAAAVWDTVKAFMTQTKIMGLSLGWWTLIAAAVVAAIAIISKLVITQKEANKAIDEANQKYDEEKQKLKELEDQLKSVQDRIKELESMDSLSIVEQSELDKLKQSEDSLQRQIALQNQLTEAAQRNQANEIAKNWDTSSKLTTKPKDITKSQHKEWYDNDGTYHSEFIEETLDDYKARIGFQDTADWAIANPEEYQKILSWQEEINNAQAKWLEENAEQIQKNEDNYKSYLEAVNAGTIQEDRAKLNEMQADLKNQRTEVFGEDYNEKVLAPLIDNIFGTLTKKDFEKDTDWSTKISQDDLDAAGVSAIDFDDYMDSMIEEALKFVDVEDLASLESLKELTVLFNNIEQLEHFDGSNLLEFIQGVKEETENADTKADFNLDNWKQSINTLKDLNAGDTIDAEAFALLDNNMKQFFTETLDGTYMLIEGSKELKASLTNTLKDKLQSDLDKVQSSMASAGKYLDTIGESALIGEGGQGYDITKVSSQLNYISAMGGDISELTQLGTRTLDENGRTVMKYTREELEQIALAVQAVQAEFDGIEQKQSVLAQSATSIEELDALLGTGYISQEIYDSQIAMTAFTEAQAEGFDLEEVQNYAEGIEQLIDAEEGAETIAKKIAVANKKMEKGMSNLTDHWSDWSKALKKGDKESTEYVEAMSGLKDSISDILDLDINQLSEGFLESAETAEILERAVAGDKEAINDLRVAAAKDIVQQITVDESQLESDALSKIDDLAEKLPDLKLGASLDSTGMTDALNELLTTTDMSVAEMQNILNALGFDPEVEYKEVPVDQVTFSSQSASAEVINPITGAITTVTAENIGQFAEDGMVRIPTINGSKTTYRGSGGGGGGKTSGGGGGGKAKKPEKKNDSDKTRYHTIQNQLEDLKSEYEEIAEASDRAFGADKLKAMDEEIAKTDELIDKQEEYIDAISANLPKDKAIMEAYYKEIIDGPAMQFDEKGNISNYDEIQDAMYKAWNEDKYGLPEEEREAWEERYEKLEEYIEQYEETYDLLRDEETALQELINQRLDAELEKVQYEVELKLNVSDDSLAVIEFQLDMLGDNAYRAAEAIEYQTEQAEILYDKMQANEQGLKDILATSDMSVQEIQQLLEGDTSVLNGHTFTEAQMEAIRDYRDNLLDLSEELQEVREEVQQRLLDAFDEWNEELDEGIEKFDHYNTLMENFKNIIDIVGQDYLKVDNAMMGSLNQANVDNRINKVTATRDALEALLKTEAEAMEQYNAAIERGNQNDIDYWRETLDVIGEEVTSAQEEMMTAWEEALQAAAEAFEQAVELAIDNFEKALLPFGTLDEFSDAYDKQKEVADQYLDDYQQIYELSKLNRDINNSIDDTKSIAGKQKLKGLLDDINELQEEGTQLSEYDLDYLQKTYDLRLAEIALEEAQKAKNTVRLTRDNEGNFSYAYTINDDAADDAAQKYEDALYAMQETSSEYIDEMSEQLISTSKEMEEALAAVRVEDYASIEEYYQKLDEIQQYYLDRMTYMQGEMQKALDNNKALYEQDWQNYSAATGYKISDDENFAMSYKDTVLGTLFGSESDIVDFQERVNEALGDSDSGLIGELLAAYIAWSQNTDRAMVEAGTSSEEFAEDMDEAVYGDGGIMDSSNAATEAVDNMANQMVAGFDTISSAIERWQTQAGDAADSVIKEYLDVVKAYNLMVDTLSTPAGSQNAEAELSDIAYSGDDNIYIDPSVGRFATGGYTGVWDSKPKWALLDQKELVLNENDTSNFLSAIKLTRSMLETIDLNAQQQAIGGANWLNASMLRNDLTQSLEQQVHITAEFPSVTNHYEIEEALNNLINTSSQYANRKL